MKVTKPVRLLALAAVVVALMMSRASAARHRKAVSISNNVSTILSDKLLDTSERALVDLQWEVMLQNVDKLLPDSKFEKLPNLFSIEIPALVERVQASATDDFDRYKASVCKLREDIITTKLLTLTALTVNSLRTFIRSYTSDTAVLQAFERNVQAVLGSATAALRETITSNTDSRLERVTHMFDRALAWRLETYGRFLYQALRIRKDMNPNSQLETWVRIETQEIVVAKHLDGYISADLFEQYIDDADAFTAMLDAEFLNTSDVDADLEDFFSRRVANLDGIIRAQYNRIYSIRVDTIDADAVLDDNQKRILKTYAREYRQQGEASREVVSAGMDEIRALYREYTTRILREIRVVVLASFLEYEAVSLRAVTEGRQTCIIQFYEMRKALDDAFFFEYSKERSFDVARTSSDFTAEFESRMDGVSESMLGYARTGYIIDMYDEAGLFVLGRASFFFRDDDILLAAVRPMLKSVHEQYATIIPQRIKKGIESDVAQEIHIARMHVDATLHRFSRNMEFAFVVHAIDNVRVSIIDEAIAKVDEAKEVFELLSTEMVTASLQPFDFAWFQAQTEQFITDDKIRYLDMKKHVIDVSNDHARDVVSQTRSTYTLKVHQLFEMVLNFAKDASVNLEDMIMATTLQDAAARGLLNDKLGTTEESLGSLVQTLQSSTLTLLETTLGGAIRDVEVVQGIRLHNFFNTKIQKIKEEFTETVTSRVTEVYEHHMNVVEETMLELSSRAREIYRAHVDELLDMERGYRSQVTDAVAPVLQEESDKILADYNIGSFNARKVGLVQNMRNRATAAALDVGRARRSAVISFARKWSRARSDFSRHLHGEASAVRLAFMDDMRGVMKDAKDLAVDVMGHVSEVIDVLEGEIFHALETEFTGIVDSVIGSNDNDLPGQLNLESVILPVGIMDLTEAPVIPSHAFMKEHEEEGDDTVYDENGEAMPFVDEPSGLTTVEIVLALMPYDDWQQVKIKEIVDNVVSEMTDGLVQNTCRNNKPPCREGWVEYKNSWDVPCCRFDPASQGFPAWKIAKMLMKEILLALVLDLEHVLTAAKYLNEKGAGKALGKVGKAGKEGAERMARKGQQMMAKSLQKYAGKSSKQMTKAIKLASKVGGKATKKIAKSAGAQVGKIVAKKVGTKMASMGTKFLAKLSLGPIGIALFVFDMLSLALDLWDPAGYNDAQTAGQLRETRDATEKVFKETLDNEGMESPLLADPMFNMPQERQSELYLEACMEWVAEEEAKFLTKNEASFEEMPDSEVEAAIAEETDRLFLQLEEDPNLATTLLAARLENVFVQDINVRASHKHPYTDGGKDSTRTHLRAKLGSSGIVEAVLNETGVRAFNRFHTVKAKFMNSFMYNPMKRFVKRENNYMLVEEVSTKTVKNFYMVTGEQKKMRKTGGFYATLPARERELHTPNTPTIEGSQRYANSLEVNADFKAEILKRAIDGWILKDVEPEEEFWIQYDPSKSEAEMLDRTKYRSSYDKLATAARRELELLIDTQISLKVDQLAEEDESRPAVSVDHLKVVHLAQDPSNWTTGKTSGDKVLMYPLSADVDEAEKIKYTIETLPVVPDWAGTYGEHQAEVEASMKEEFQSNFSEYQEAVRVEYEAKSKLEEERLDKKANEMGKSVSIVVSQEYSAMRAQEPGDPEFAVFLNGYGQYSPLYSVYKKCQEAGRGVQYDQKKGLCTFTESYCTRYGLDFFYNKDLGVYDCELSRGQAALEYIFGTTVTRSTKRFFGSLGAPVSSGMMSIGTCRKAAGRVRVCDGVEAKCVQNGELFNYIPTATTLDAISTLGLSGF